MEFFWKCTEIKLYKQYTWFFGKFRERNVYKYTWFFLGNLGKLTYKNIDGIFWNFFEIKLYK
jgi:hypothetical protein